MNKLKVLALIIVVGVIFGWLFKDKILKPEGQNNQPSQKGVSETDSAAIVSTKPDPLEEAIVSATEVIEVSFNKPLQNTGEFKLRIEPEMELKIELSSDRKTAKIIPLKPYDLGVTYTLFIGPDTKFDGVGNWGQEKIYHFKTITYRGV